MSSLHTKPHRLLPLAVLAFVVLHGCSGQDGPGNLRDIDQTGGAVVTGTVRDTEGRDAEDAVVTLELMVAGRAASVAARSGLTADMDLAKSARVRTAVADPRGRYLFDGLAAGDYLLTTTLRDHAGASNSLGISPAAAAKAETTVVDIQLMPTGTILGNATRENAADHSGSIVFVDGTSYVAVTDAGGDYSLTGVPIGTRPVHATYPGFLDDMTSAMLGAAGDSTTASSLFLRLSSNMPPVVDSIGATLQELGTPTAFSGSGHDPDGVVVLYEWDFENDGIFDWSSGAGAATQYVYPTAGQFLAKLRISDDQGGFGLSVVDVTVLQPLPTGAIFVAETGDDGAIGSALQPVRTIVQALVLAQGAGMDSVLVATGEFPGAVDLIDGIGIFGGRDPLTWADTAGHSHLTGGTRPLRGTGIASATRVEGLHVESDDALAPGEASVAISLVDCGSLLEFADCLVTAGDGAPGTAGNPGSPGNNANNGGAGINGVCDDTPNRPGGGGGYGFYYGGSGGTGGNSNNNGNNGSFGSTGGGGGGGGGYGGITDDPGTNAGNGGVGAAGVNGAGGTAASATGTVVGGVWQPFVSNTGTTGQGGRGGGGGGGGGGQSYFLAINGVGGSGGGGGGGGFPGQPGTGGQGGGASLGFLLDNSTPLVIDCTITNGSGGQGGNGGQGGAGGQGGFGGTRGNRDCSDVGLGGFGGAGGSGGYGGGGGGGAGGPSFGIFSTGGGGVADITSVTFVPGSGGTGGPGGGGAAAGQAGQTGPSGSVWP